MAFVSYDDLLGTVDLTVVDTVGPGPFVIGGAAGRQTFYNLEVRGYDPALGGGTFLYARFSGTIAAGTVVELTPSLSSGVVIHNATAWAGTANTGKPLAVAVSAGTVGQFGWFQIAGNAITTTAGSPAAGNSVYYGAAAGSVRPTANAGSQVLGAQYSTAVSQTIGTGTTAVTLSSTQAVVFLNRPVAQSAIT